VLFQLAQRAGRWTLQYPPTRIRAQRRHVRVHEVLGVRPVDLQEQARTCVVARWTGAGETGAGAGAGTGLGGATGLGAGLGTGIGVGATAGGATGLVGFVRAQMMEQVVL
jgi:hypothetical protein